jgi:hypothetical protein
VFKGGTDGNEQLTAQIGVLLLLPLAAVGVTIPFIGQMIWAHLFIGLLLLGPVIAKIGSTGYRFLRYYTRDPPYVRKGPPPLILRVIAPVVVISTVLVFVTGVVLLFKDPAHRDPWLLIHKVSFIVWVAFTAVHVLGHLLELPRSLRAADRTDRTIGRPPGSSGRWITVVGSVVGGAVLAIALIPQFSPWTARGAIGHHHHHHEVAAVTSRTRPPSTRG